MIRLLRKELRQGRWLPLFGLALSLGVVSLHRVLPALRWTPGEADSFCAGVLGIAPVFLAVFAAAGLIAREKVAGTLPHLLGLPLSRGQIWCAKIIAGLLLFLATWMMMVVPAVLIAPRLLTAVHLQSFLLEALLWGLAGLALTLLASTLSERPVGALLAGTALTLGLFLGVCYLMAEQGAFLTGWDSEGLFDAGLWAWIGLPAGLLGSWAAFRKGELLARRRKWLFGVTTCALTLLACFAVTVGLAHHAFAYRRGAVREIRQPMVTAGRAISLYALASPSPRERSYARGWQEPRKARYRAQDLVLVGADSGADLLSLQAPTPYAWSSDPGLGHEAAISPDGRYAAVLAKPVPLTWGQAGYEATRSLQVWDLHAHRVLYSGLPPADPPVVKQVKWDDVPQLHRALWSPDGRWLALWARTEAEAQLLTLHPDGSQVRTGRIYSSYFSPDQYGGWGVPLGAAVNYAWAPDSGSIYLLGKGAALVRRIVPQGREQVLWRPPRLASDREWTYGEVAVSPDGKWVAVALSAEEASRWLIGVVAADGSSSRFIADGPCWLGWRYLTWSPGGEDLYFVGGSEESRQTVSRWRVGSKAAVPICGLLQGVRLAPLSRDRGVLIWSRGRVLVAGADGDPHPLTTPGVQELARRAEWVGVTHSGEVIVQLSARAVEALDLRTGARRRIYP